jgi:hypothetical protein
MNPQQDGGGEVVTPEGLARKAAGRNTDLKIGSNGDL